VSLSVDGSGVVELVENCCPRVDGEGGGVHALSEAFS